jgi:hypothetical protein
MSQAKKENINQYNKTLLASIVVLVLGFLLMSVHISWTKSDTHQTIENLKVVLYDGQTPVNIKDSEVIEEAMLTIEKNKKTKK